MKKLNYLFYMLALPAMAFLASCGGDDEPTPDVAPDAKVFTTTMTSTNKGNSGTAIVTGKVTTADGTVKLRIDASGGGDDLDQIFILKSEDNGALVPVVSPTLSDITNSYTTFKAGTDESYKITGNIKSFVLDVPVSVRTSSSAVTDVYYIWITKKNVLGGGSFTKPTKNLVLGSSVITLNYTAASVVAFSTGTDNIGDQSAVPGSLLVTSGDISAFKTADYNDAPESADISLSSLNTDANGKLDGGTPYFISPSIRGDLGFSEPTGSNSTIIETYSGSFTGADGTTLADLTFGTGDKVLVQATKTYKFKTAKGKKGLLYVNTLTEETDGDKGWVANVSVKVQN